MKKPVFLALSLFVLAVPAMAQDTRESLRNNVLDLSVPDSPAFTVLGLTPETVVRPTTPRGLATALLNGVDANGNFQTGVAIDTAPYFLWKGSRITLGQYNANYGIRFFSRLQVSLATAKGTSENDKAARLSAGLHTTPWDAGDARANRSFQSELSAARKAAIDRLTAMGITPPDSINKALNIAYDTRLDQEIRTITSEIREKYKRAGWNASSLSFGVAPTWISADGTRQTVEWSGGAAWGSLSYGFERIPGLEDTAQIIVHGRYRGKDHVPVPDTKNTYTIQNTSLGAARFRVGNEKGSGAFEVAYLHTDPITGPAVDDYVRLSGGGEARIADNLWLKVELAGESGRRDNRQRLFLVTSFKWGLDEREPE